MNAVALTAILKFSQYWDFKINAKVEISYRNRKFEALKGELILVIVNLGD